MVQNNRIVELQRDAYVKDLGVVFDEKLNFRQHISERINKAYSMLWLIRRNFQHICPAAFVLIYKHLVRSHLEYNNSVWTPYRKLDIQGGPKKLHTELMAITLSILNGFSKLFHCWKAK